MAKKNVKEINLALQGGGAHGAYTWGVLDRLLEEEDISFHAVSGTSAGAMNAVVLADGFREGGREGAKNNLALFWENISRMGLLFNPTNRSDLEEFAEGWNIDTSFSYRLFDMMTRMFSPYQLNPFNLNPLRDVLTDMINWERINEGGDIHLFVTATSVHTGRPRVFRSHEINEDVLLASACIPFFFQSVEIEGEPYWDGGYSGNPSIWPLIYKSDVKDVLLVQINPIVRMGTPTNANDIINRLNEITFNSSLIAEMRAINFVSKLVSSGKLEGENYRNMHIHMIEAPDQTHGLNASSKVNTDLAFLRFLFGIGRERAEEWLRINKKDIGNRSTVDIQDVFLGVPSEEIAGRNSPVNKRTPKKASTHKSPAKRKATIK